MTPAGTSASGPSSVAAVPAAPSDVALEHFASLLSLETDCWDVHDALANGPVDFVLLDVRSPELYAAGHLPGAVNLPHRRIVERNLVPYPPDALFVVYCAGPHCNGADKAAMAELITILQSREPFYARARMSLDTTNATLEQSLAALLRTIQSYCTSGCPWQSRNRS